jgi:hypothetical protein
MTRQDVRGPRPQLVLRNTQGGNYYQWEPDRFQGTVTDDNTDVKKVNHKKSVIGELNFAEAPFYRGPGGNWEVIIGPHTPPWTRAVGQDEENEIGYNFTLGDVGNWPGGNFIMQDLMTYGSITSVTWAYNAGCPKDHTRVLYGYHTDPVEAGRVLSGCEKTKAVF